MDQYKITGNEFPAKFIDMLGDHYDLQNARSIVNAINKEYPKVKARVVKVKKPNKPKYKLGDMLFSYQNRKKAGKVIWVYESNDADFDHKYVLELPDGGRSNHINEKSLAKTKNAKKLFN